MCLKFVVYFNNIIYNWLRACSLPMLYDIIKCFNASFFKNFFISYILLATLTFARDVVIQFI